MSNKNFSIDELPFSNILLANNYLTLHGAGIDPKFFCGSFEVYLSLGVSAKKSLFNFGLLLDSYYILLSKYYAHLKKDFLTGTALQNRSVKLEEKFFKDFLSKNFPDIDLSNKFKQISWGQNRLFYDYLVGEI